MRKLLLIVLTTIALVAPALVVAASVAPAQAAAPAKFGAVIEKRVIGHSVQGRKIWAFRLGSPKSKKKVLLLAGMHGNELAASKTLRALRDGHPIHGADFWVVPVVNPDGAAKHRRKNARGVDLNRNFSTGWRKQGGATSSGSKAFSEPETRAIRNFANRIKPKYTVSYHQPLNGIDIRDTGNKAWAKRLAAAVRLPKKSFDCNAKCHGTYSMWIRKHHPRGAVITVELPSRPSEKYLTRIAARAVMRSVGGSR